MGSSTLQRSISLTGTQQSSRPSVVGTMQLPPFSNNIIYYIHQKFKNRFTNVPQGKAAFLGVRPVAKSQRIEGRRGDIAVVCAGKCMLHHFM